MKYLADVELCGFADTGAGAEGGGEEIRQREEKRIKWVTCHASVLSLRSHARAGGQRYCPSCPALAVLSLSFIFFS